jgi:quinol monooxygenase YgiN
MKPEIVIACYRPREGKDEALKKLLLEHVPTLRNQELITDRPIIQARAEDGTWLEVFEWRSKEAASQAHEHPAVAKVWEAMAKVCEFATLDSLPEASKPFAHFMPAN